MGDVASEMAALYRQILAETSNESATA